MADNLAILEMRQAIKRSREHFLKQVEAAVGDIEAKANSISKAIGEVSPEIAAAALAGYARERIGQIRND